MDRPPPDSPALRKLKRGWNTVTYQERMAFLAMVMQTMAKRGRAEYG